MAATTETAVYKVGSLSALFSGNAKAEDEEKTKSLTSIFKSRSVLPKKVAPPAKTKAGKEEDEEPPTKKAKKKADAQDAEGSDKKKKGEVKDGEEEEEATYKTPSRKFQVRDELTKEKKLDPEKEGRTVFVGNLPSTVNPKAIKRRFKEYGEVECVRLRNVARPDMTTTKKIAVIKRKMHEKRHNINAYVRFKSKEDAVKSCALNGEQFDEHVIRVDMAMPSGSGKANANPDSDDKSGGGKADNRDQSKSVFLGNLSFSIEEDAVRKHFKVCGGIVDVRLVRDALTGMGKGFGYVNFEAGDSVVLALRLNGSKLEGREIRVTRATNKPKQKMVAKTSGGKTGGKPGAASNGMKNSGKGSKNFIPLKNKKFVNKPKVEFQGKVGLKTRELKVKQKKAKKFGGGGKKQMNNGKAKKATSGGGPKSKK